MTDASTPSTQPDQRFTVGGSQYNLDKPGFNTWTSILQGIAAAMTGAGTLLGIATESSQRIVEVHSDTYQGSPSTPIQLVPNVHLRGIGGDPESVIIDGYGIGHDGGHGTTFVTGIHFKNCVFNLSNSGGTARLVFVGCKFTECSMHGDLSHAGDAAYVLIGCTGYITSAQFDIAEGVGATLHLIGSQGSAGAVEPGLLTLVTPIRASGSGALSVYVAGTQTLVLPGAPTGSTHLFVVEDDVYGSLFTSNCELVNSVETAIVKHRSSIPFDLLLGSGTELMSYPPSLVDTNGQANVAIAGDVTVFGNTSAPVGGGEPLGGGLGGGVVTQTRMGALRHRLAVDAHLDVPPPGSSITAQTINPTGASHAYADEFRLSAKYANLSALQPNSSAPSFQYATWILKDPKFLPDGHRVTLTNVSGDGTGYGPIALRLPNGTSSRLQRSRQPDISVHPNLMDSNFIMLVPDQSVTLSVERPDSGPARYWIV